MAKVSKEFLEVFVRASGRFPVELAPKAIQDAIATADAANSAWVDAVDLASDAVFDEPNAQALWDAEAESRVRAGQSLPDREALDVARIKVKTTAEDAAAAKRALDTAHYQLGLVLSDAAALDSWRHSIEEKAKAMQSSLFATVAKLEPTVDELGWLLGLSSYLGDIGAYNYPPKVDGSNAVASLRTLAATPAWKPAPTPMNITRNEL